MDLDPLTRTTLALIAALVIAWMMLPMLLAWLGRIAGRD